MRQSQNSTKVFWRDDGFSSICRVGSLRRIDVRAIWPACHCLWTPAVLTEDSEFCFCAAPFQTFSATDLDLHKSLFPSQHTYSIRTLSCRTFLPLLTIMCDSEDSLWWLAVPLIYLPCSGDLSEAFSCLAICWRMMLPFLARHLLKLKLFFALQCSIIARLVPRAFRSTSDSGTNIPVGVYKYPGFTLPKLPHLPQGCPHVDFFVYSSSVTLPQTGAVSPQIFRYRIFLRRAQYPSDDCYRCGQSFSS